MTDEHTIRLTRRRALGGLAAVGVASAGAGIGTTAYFSDREEFDGNTITAGEFGLTVEQYIAHVDQDGMGPDEQDFDAASEGEGVWVTAPIDIEDAKPGDEYEFCWKITVEENPGYVAVVGDSSDKNGKEADNIGLDDLWDIDDEEELKSLGEAADATLTTTTFDDDGNVDETYTEKYGSLGSLLDSLEGGILVSKGEGDVIQFGVGETVKVCLTIEIPTGVGNAIQGAVTETDMTFYAEQARHNDPDDVKANAAGD